MEESTCNCNIVIVIMILARILIVARVRPKMTGNSDHLSSVFLVVEPGKIIFLI